jgi:plasmid stabilization system protein ParE
MGEVRYAPRAAAKLMNLCEFYENLDVALGDRVRNTIVNALNPLIEHPGIGRPDIELPKFREKVIRFGSSNFLALYYVDGVSGDVIIVSLRHEREMAYSEQGDA